jgi:hypothetical protein
MAITSASAIAGQSYAASVDKALAYVSRIDASALDAFTEAYIRKLYALCVAVGIRFELAFAQWCDETNVGRSQLWKARHNPAGIGALPDGTYMGITYQTPAQAAMGHLLHLWLYVKGTTLPPDLAPYVALDPRWQAAIKAGYAGKAPTLAGLASTWATNALYATQIAAHANQAFSNLPEGAPAMGTVTFGNVPKPAFVDDYIPTFSGMAMDDLGQRTIKGVVWHRMVGYLNGTRQQFRIPGTGLTDYGVGVGGWDDASLDGVIYRWNDPLGRRAGWASGPAEGVGVSPWGDGLAFLNEYGLNAVNRDQVSIEISGNYTTPLTAKSRAAIVALTAYYADQAHIPWDSFPIWPGHGYSFVRWHNEFCGQLYKLCPGSVVMNETATLLDAVAARLKQYQTGSAIVKPASYASLVIPAWLTKDLADGVMRDHGSVYGVEREYTAIRETGRYRSATKRSQRVGPNIKQGESFMGSHVIGADWVLTPFGTRVYMPDLSPQVIIRPRAA